MSPGPTTAILATLLSCAAFLGCGNESEPPPFEELACPAGQTVATLADLNYPEEDCAGAMSLASEKLDSRRYRTACRAEGAALPETVLGAAVTDCRTTDGRGVFVDVEVCCPDPVEAAGVTESVTRAPGPECPDRHTRAVAGDLHYPDAGSCEQVIPRAETELDSRHYRKACSEATPRSGRKPQVIEARVVECRAGGDGVGVSVDVELCCEARVFDENLFRALVMDRGPQEIRAALGDPETVAEDPSGIQWSYPIEVARGDQVFPRVTLIFADGQVDSYYFGTD